MNEENQHQHQKMQARAIETRLKIKEAARLLFRERGYQETTSKQISERAGVSIGSFYVYFQDKQEVFQDLIEDYFIEIESIGMTSLLNEAQDPSRREIALKKLIHNVKDFADSMGEFYESLNQVSQYSREIQDSIVIFEEKIIMQTKSTIESMTAIRHSSDPLAQAYLLYSFIDLNIHRFRRPLPGVGMEQIIDEMTKWLDHLLFEKETIEKY